MINKRLNFTFRPILCCILILTTNILALQTYADVIITVDISNPAAIFFQTTSNNAEAAFTDTAFNGVTVKDFFSGNSTTANEMATSGSIEILDSATATTMTPLDNIYVGSAAGGYTTNDFTFYDATGVGSPTIFSFANQRALSGSVTFDLSTFTGLPAYGETGDVYIGRPNDGQIIGQWMIVDTMITMTGDNNPSFNGTLSPWVVGTELEIGINSAGNASSNGAVIQSSGGSVGVNVGSIGEMTISGAGAYWDNSADVEIGSAGIGTLNLQTGGLFSAVDACLGLDPTSTGIANVDGDDSKFTTSSDLTIGNSGLGQFTMTNGSCVDVGDRTFVGYMGTGEVNATDSEFTSARFLVLGDTATGVGTATFDNSRLKIFGGTDADLIIGRHGQGQLFLKNDADATVDTNLFIGVTADSTGDNRIEISGESSLEVDDVIIHVGQGGNGTFILESGSTVSGRSFSVGSNAGSTGTAIFDGVGTLSFLSYLFLGNSGEGEMTVSNGAVAEFVENEGFAHNFNVGRRNDAIGTLNVMGTGSNVTANKIAEIGGSNNSTGGGTGTVNVSGGGTVNTPGVIVGTRTSTGTSSGGHGTINISGVDSKWQASSLVLGDIGEGYLNIIDGGNFTTTFNVRVGDRNTTGDGPAEVVVSGTAMSEGAPVPSTFVVGTELRVGDNRAATMTIENGGAVNSGLDGSSEAIIGDFPTAHNVLVTVDNGTWNHQSTGLFKIGADGGSAFEPTIMRVINGGQVTTGGRLELAADTAPSHGVLEISGAGSEVASVGAFIGDHGTGTLNILNGGAFHSSNFFISFAEQSTASGTGLISGPGSSMSSDSFIDIGFDGVGILTVEDEASVSGLAINLAPNQGSQGILNVQTNANVFCLDLRIGDFNSANGELNIDGGLVEVASRVDMHINNSLNLAGGKLKAAEVHPEGGDFNFLGGTLSTGIFGSTEFPEDLFQAGGTLAPEAVMSNVGSTEIFGQYFLLSSGNVEFDIEGSSTMDYDQVIANGNAIVEGTVLVNLNGFEPVAGDSFSLLLASGSYLGTPSFDFSNASLPNGLTWETGNFLVDGSISVTGSPIVLGDVNCDGVVNLLDVQPFVALISSGGFLDKADINQDGVVNLLDVDPFITLLSGDQ